MKTIWLMAIVFSVTVATGVCADNPEHYVYCERIGDASKTVEWMLDRAGQAVLIYRTEDQVHITTTDPALATVEWRCEIPDRNTVVVARREGDTIVLTGEHNGLPVDHRFEVDAAPWYQATSISLRNLVLREHTRATFWTIRADTLDPHKIVAVKQGDEILSINGRHETAVRIQLRLAGLLSPFWKSDYWFRKSDGVFLRFEGPSGPPGEPRMVVTYQGTVGQALGCPKDHVEQ